MFFLCYERSSNAFPTFPLLAAVGHKSHERVCALPREVVITIEAIAERRYGTSAQKRSEPGIESNGFALADGLGTAVVAEVAGFGDVAGAVGDVGADAPNV